jgi:alpha-1,4-digalacturonate transport system permease protein
MNKKTLGYWANLFGLTLGAVVMAIPLYWVLVISLRPRAEVFDPSAGIWPNHSTLEAFALLFNDSPALRWIGNTAFVAGVSAALTVLLNLLAGYAFAKLRFFGRDVLFVVFLGTIMVPIQVILVPEFLLLSRLHLLNSPWGVILPRCAEAFGIFMSRQFMLSIPNDLIEAARLDGAREFSIFFRIVLPLCKPLVAVLVIFTVIWRWNDIAWPLVVLTDQSNYMLQQGLNLLAGDPNPNWPVVMALAVVTVAPMIALFFVCQRFLVQGIAGTGIK